MRPGGLVQYLEEAVCVLVTQVNVDHLQQHSDLIIAHLVIVVLVGPAQVRMDPGERPTWSRKQQVLILLGHEVDHLVNGEPRDLVTSAAARGEGPGIQYQLVTRSLSLHELLLAQSKDTHGNCPFMMSLKTVFCI